MKPLSHMQGFSLLELAIALVILSLLSGSLILPLMAQRDVGRLRQAQEQLALIHEALLGYASLHGHLPCPDTNTDSTHATYGMAASDCATTTREGYLPFRSLGLAEPDPWGQRWRYRVDAHFARTSQPIGLDTDFGADQLELVNHKGEPLSTTVERPVAILFSMGPNGRADGENLSYEAAGGRYESDLPTASFDDQLHWIARPILLSRLIAAGRQP